MQNDGLYIMQHYDGIPIHGMRTRRLQSNNGKDDEKTPNSFDFSTTSSIQVNVKYDVPEGYKVLFEIYLENPFTIDKNGQIMKRTDLKPVIRRMTDGNGAYNGKEIISRIMETKHISILPI